MEVSILGIIPISILPFHNSSKQVFQRLSKASRVSRRIIIRGSLKEELFHLSHPPSFVHHPHNISVEHFIPQVLILLSALGKVIPQHSQLQVNQLPNHCWGRGIIRTQGIKERRMKRKKMERHMMKVLMQRPSNNLSASEITMMVYQMMRTMMTKIRRMMQKKLSYSRIRSPLSNHQ